MAKRQGPGEGTIRERPDGTWEARITYYDAGRRRRKSLYAKTRTAVARKLRGALTGLAKGQPVVGDERLTVAQCLSQWLEESARLSVRDRTFQSYAEIVRLHLIPTVGQRRLTKLTALDVQRMLNEKLGAGLSPRRVQYIRAVLRMALNWVMGMEDVGLIRNVAAIAKAPSVRSTLVQPLAPTEVRTLLETIHGDRLEALYIVAISVGLRQGELLGLRWQDVDLDTGTLRVCQALYWKGTQATFVEPKSRQSRRTVALPTLAAGALCAHRLRQLEERLQAGAVWGDTGLVFTTTIGTPMDPSNLRRSFSRAITAAGLPRQRFHDLRHCCATLLLVQGVSARVVMETLGHSQISLTLNTYSHVMPLLQREAADRMDALLGPRSQMV